VGGLLVSQLLTLYTTPVVYLYLDRFQVWMRRPNAHEDASTAPKANEDSSTGRPAPAE
jgi:multidrug efflux pump